MGGSGGGGPFFKRSPDKLREMVRDAEDKTKVAEFETKLAHTLGELLGTYNARDAEAVRGRLNSLKSALEESIEGSFDQLFGGSVAKHTYVDGLSDIDSLLIISDSALAGNSPDQVLSRMEKIIRRKLGSKVEVSHGHMAVTVKYADGMVIQLLPALKDRSGRIHVPSSSRDGWSRIDPIGFQEALTRRNNECGNKLVPTIKLAKAVIGQMPEPQRLSGYHLESLAIAAFRNYKGEKTTSAMLPVLFERARDLVLSPMTDSTGQSVHVDAYLGPANSMQRQVASHLLDRLARRMRNATAAASTAQWRALFGLDE